MKRLVAACAVFLSATVFGQQTKSPVSDVAREMLAGREKNTVAAFEQMPADKFGYKPTPDQMTFGHLAAHIASGNYFFCSNAGDVPRPKTEELKGTEDKAKLVAVSRLRLNSVAPPWPKPTTQNSMTISPGSMASRGRERGPLWRYPAVGQTTTEWPRCTFV